MNRKKKKVLLPGGIDNFHKLVTHRDDEGNRCIFVDKTLFIKSFLGSSDEIALITRPRRFGKTLTLSMVQHFLAAEVSGQKTKGLFDGLKVSQYPETMRYQGQHPVIFATLKSAKGGDFQEFFSRIQEIVRELFRMHRYLLDHNIAQDDRALFEKFLNKKASRSEYQNSLRLLSELLYRHTSKKVYILLDEYDTPINDAYVNEYYEECRKFLSAMLGEAFKGNDALERGLITGILKIAKASLLSELNNLKVYTMLNDARYAHYFGFTEEETDDFLDRAGLPQKAHELKDMYNGYELEGYTLYNPFSIVGCTSELLLRGPEQMEKALRPYWINTGGTHLIANIIHHNVRSLASGLGTLVQGKAIDTFIDEEVVFDPNLRDNPVAFWSILLLAGYLKVVGKEEEGGFYRYKVTFPNEEIRRTLERTLLSVVTGSDHKIFTYLDGMRSLVKGDIEAFSSFLKKYMAHVPSYFDTGGPNKEPFYQGLVLGMASVLSYTHHITSNRESGKGRFDISITPKNIQDKGVLLELKVDREGKEDLKALAHKALEQIEGMAYAGEMKKLGVKEIICVGVAFRDKEVEVVRARKD